MQEDINRKSVALSVQTTKLTARVLARAIAALLRRMRNPNAKHGRMSVKSLARQGASLKNIEITDHNIRAFERVARKYGVDFALKKDIAVYPPRWLVFFKGRDADALTAAFSEFTAKTIGKGKDTQRPSLLAQLSKFKELVKNTTVDREKHKERGGREL